MSRDNINFIKPLKNQNHKIKTTLISYSSIIKHSMELFYGPVAYAPVKSRSYGLTVVDLIQFGLFDRGLYSRKFNSAVVISNEVISAEVGRNLKICRQQQFRIVRHVARAKRPAGPHQNKKIQRAAMPGRL